MYRLIAMPLLAGRDAELDRVVTARNLHIHRRLSFPPGGGHALDGLQTSSRILRSPLPPASRPPRRAVSTRHTVHGALKVLDGLISGRRVRELAVVTKFTGRCGCRGPADKPPGSTSKITIAPGSLVPAAPLARLRVEIVGDAGTLSAVGKERLSPRDLWLVVGGLTGSVWRVL